MKIITWNVNGIRAAINNGFLEKLEHLDADIICLQEVKATKKQTKFKTKNYIQYWNSSRREGYSGVLTLVKHQPVSVRHGFGIEIFDIEGRISTIEYNDFYVLNVYFPMSQSGLKRKDYRNDWDKVFLNYIKTLKKPLIICGDFNVAHRYIDIYEENLLNIENNIGFESIERANFDRLLNSDLVDVFRYKYPNIKAYTWWSYRLNKRDENRGWRLDYFLISTKILKVFNDITIHSDIAGSDHCPISLDIGLTASKKGAELKEELDLINEWDNANWEKLEYQLLRKQKLLARKKYVGNLEKCIVLQKEIVMSKFAKMLAVRHVTNANSEAGIDGVKWISSAEKMRAALSLTSKNYKAKPYKTVLIHDGISRKERYINIPTHYDKAMQVLYTYALSPVAEAMADRKSFAFRKGRSTFDADIYLRNGLSHNEDLFIFKGDIKSYYETIGHKWLLKNIDMDKKILKEFLKAGTILNGELFPVEDGISLGGSISPIIGNIVLDGMQVYIYDCLYKNESINYKCGNFIRFADDFIVIVKDEEQALEVKNYLFDFLMERGLRLSEEKTQIINASQGFDFLGRQYVKRNNIVVVTPSEKSITNFEIKLKNKIEHHKGSIDLLIKSLNQMITGYATYHRVEDSEEAFRRIDATIQTLLIEKVKKLHPKRAWKQLQDKYWYKNHNGKLVFTHPDSKELQVIQLKEVKYVTHFAIKTGFNSYLDEKYYEKIEKIRNVEKVSGTKNKAIWNRQGGNCYHCGKPILADHKIELISISVNNKDFAYVHSVCKFNFFEDVVDIDFDGINTFSLLENLQKDIIAVENPYIGLYDFFLEEKRQVFTLEFSEIEEIIGDNLIEEAYVFSEFWYDEIDYLYENCEYEISYNTSITNTWLSNGYIIQSLNVDECKVIFRKENHDIIKCNVPSALLNKKIPKNAQHELDNFCKYLIKKYGIK